MLTPSYVLELIKAVSSSCGFSADLSQITVDDDLLEKGLDSLDLLSLISSIEKQTNLTLSLDLLEQYHFRISASSLSSCLVSETQ